MRCRYKRRDVLVLERTSRRLLRYDSASSYLDCEKVLPVPWGDVADAAEFHLVSQRHREVVAAAVEAGMHVRGCIHGYALGHDELFIADWPVGRSFGIKLEATHRGETT